MGTGLREGATIRVRRLAVDGRLRALYSGRVVQAAPGGLVVEAFWERPPMDLGYAVLEPGDRFVEYFFTDRWFAIYEIHRQGDGGLKGWYCDIAYPARISSEEIETRDLALDLFVTPQGQMVVLDEEEFEALDLPARDPEAYRAARAALADLMERVRRREPPFHAIAGEGRPA